MMDYRDKLPNFPIHNVRDFLLGLPETVPTEMREGVDTLFHFDIEGTGGGQFTVAIQNKEIQVFEDLRGEPKCKVTAKEHNLLALLRGELNPMMAVFTGKIKISNPGEVMKYAKMFGMA